MNAVTNYLENVLTPMLRTYGVAEEFIDYTSKTIEVQITSLLRNWDDVAFRKTVLLLGSEEGPFYEPAGKYDTKCFVVVAIRNSPIETIQSESYQRAGLSAAISSRDVRAITGSAIRYFNNQDFAKLCKEAKHSAAPDLYREASEKFPAAWAALQKLGTTSAKVVEYQPILTETPYQMDEPVNADGQGKTANGDMVKSIFDAYVPEMDPELMTLLKDITSAPNGALVVDSFKTLTRNFEKLLKIIEYILTRGHVFATANYYLENGHVERRTQPLRAGHTVNEMQAHFMQTSGLGHRHAAVLRNLMSE